MNGPPTTSNVPVTPAWTARVVAACMAVLTVCAVAATAGGGYWLLVTGPRPGSLADDRPQSRMPPARETGSPPKRTAAPAPPPPRPAGPPPLRAGDLYYAYVKIIELRPKKPDGESWDMRGGLPDVTYKLFLNGEEFYQGDVRDNRLIAEWDLIKLNVRDALISGDAEVAGAVNARLVRARADATLRVEVYDDDSLTYSDLAGRFDLPMKSLHEGINVLRPEEGGVQRLVLDLVPRDATLDELIDRANQR